MPMNGLDKYSEGHRRSADDHHPSGDGSGTIRVSRSVDSACDDPHAPRADRSVAGTGYTETEGERAKERMKR